MILIPCKHSSGDELGSSLLYLGIPCENALLEPRLMAKKIIRNHYTTKCVCINKESHTVDKLTFLIQFHTFSCKKRCKKHRGSVQMMLVVDNWNL